jgi:hypothetical protein
MWNALSFDIYENLRFDLLIKGRFPPGFSFQQFDFIMKNDGFTPRADPYLAILPSSPQESVEHALPDQYYKVSSAGDPINESIELFFEPHNKYAKICGPKSWIVYFWLDEQRKKIVAVRGRYERLVCSEVM